MVYLTAEVGKSTNGRYLARVVRGTNLVWQSQTDYLDRGLAYQTAVEQRDRMTAEASK